MIFGKTLSPLINIMETVLDTCTCEYEESTCVICDGCLEDARQATKFDDLTCTCEYKFDFCDYCQAFCDEN